MAKKSFGDVIEGIRDRLNILIEHHERQEHQGKPCFFQRIAALAFLADSLGLYPTTFTMRALQQAIKDESRRPEAEPPLECGDGP